MRVHISRVFDALMQEGIDREIACKVAKRLCDQIAKEQRETLEAKQADQFGMLLSNINENYRRKARMDAIDGDFELTGVNGQA